MTSDGPTGWHNTNLDQGIKAFQKAHGFKVDGLLKPNGPTITKIGGLLGVQTQPPAPRRALTTHSQPYRNHRGHGLSHEWPIGVLFPGMPSLPMVPPSTTATPRP